MREGERLEPAVVSTWQTRAVTLWGRWPRFSFFRVENMSRENQIPSIPSYNLLGDHQTGDASSRRGRKCKKKRDSDIELGSSGRRGQQHRKLEEGNAAAERVVPIFIELQLTLKYFQAAKQAGELVPGWPAGGGTSNPRWRPLSAAECCAGAQCRWTAAGSRRLMVERGARAQPSPARRQRPTQTRSNITRLQHH